MSDDRPTPSTCPAASAGVEEDLVSAVLTASRVLVAISARSLGTVAETLTLPQFRMLVVLQTRGEMSMSRLAEYLAVNPSTALRMIERLVTVGMVTRQPGEHDRREVLIALTPQGAHTVTAATDRRREEIARIVASMPPGRRAGLIEALRAFADAGGEPPAPHRQLDLLGW
ncbi:MarR family transcriptional regulator [Kitasatospora sp. NBC_00070]|uniref:MarR family winged helix-turn-helix transcriptional regulator n=1 Tax=Kitasatospora sp. NBC_00070 TaxID=2975962 RepID=UPI00324AFC26